MTIAGRNTREFENAGFEPERNEVVSFVYQDMVFETNLPIGDAMAAENGVDRNAAAADLTDRLSVRMLELSKGEM